AVPSRDKMDVPKAPWTAAARRRLCPRPYFKAASSRRSPRCFAHLQRRAEGSWESAGFRQSPTGDERDPSPTALRSPLSPTERDRNQNHSPLPGGEGGPQGGGGPTFCTSWG